MIVECDNPPQGTVGTPYSHTLLVTGGSPPYLFTVVDGGLPDGLELNPVTGEIYGTPTVANTFSFTIRATELGA